MSVHTAGQTTGALEDERGGMPTGEGRATGSCCARVARVQVSLVARNGTSNRLHTERRVAEDCAASR